MEKSKNRYVIPTVKIPVFRALYNNGRREPPVYADSLFSSRCSSFCGPRELPTRFFRFCYSVKIIIIFFLTLLSLNLYMYIYIFHTFLYIYKAVSGRLTQTKRPRFTNIRIFVIILHRLQNENPGDYVIFCIYYFIDICAATFYSRYTRNNNDIIL